MNEYTDQRKLHWYDIPCHACGQAETNSWDKRCSRALGYRHIVCEQCISREYGISIGELRSTMRNHFGLVPCPGI